VNTTLKKISLFFATIGPGLFLVGYNIGTGSITSMASAGASYGMALTWAVLISCIFTYILIVTFGRFTLITGESALQSFKKHFGKLTSGFVLFVLVFTEMVSSIGVMAIVTDVIREWSRPLTSSGEGFNTIILTIIIGVTLVFLLFNGKYNFIENILSVFVALMGICFILTTFMVIPDASSVISGLVPGIPEEANAGLLVAGMIGTTMGGVLYVTRSITIKQKNWSVAELKLENAIDMIKLLEPLAGRFAISVFVAGIVCAGLSSLFPHYMLVPLLLSDYNNEEFKLSTTRNRSVVVFYAALGLVVPIFGGRPVVVMIASQALTLVITPVVIILMQIIQNKSEVMGNYKMSKAMNGMLILISLFTIYMAVVGTIGIIEIF